MKKHKRVQRKIASTWLLLQFWFLVTRSVWTEKKPVLVEWKRTAPKQMTLSVTYLNHLFDDEIPEEYR